MGHSAEPGARLSVECKNDVATGVSEAKRRFAVSHSSRSIVGKPSSSKVQTRDFRVLVFLEVQCLWKNSVSQLFWLVAPEPMIPEGGAPG